MCGRHAAAESAREQVADRPQHGACRGEEDARPTAKFLIHTPFISARAGDDDNAQQADDGEGPLRRFDALSQDTRAEHHEQRLHSQHHCHVRHRAAVDCGEETKGVSHIHNAAHRDEPPVTRRGRREELAAVGGECAQKRHRHQPTQEDGLHLRQREHDLLDDRIVAGEGAEGGYRDRSASEVLTARSHATPAPRLARARALCWGSLLCCFLDVLQKCNGFVLKPPGVDYSKPLCLCGFTLLPPLLCAHPDEACVGRSGGGRAHSPRSRAPIAAASRSRLRKEVGCRAR